MSVATSQEIAGFKLLTLFNGPVILKLAGAELYQVKPYSTFVFNPLLLAR